MVQGVLTVEAGFLDANTAKQHEIGGIERLVWDDVDRIWFWWERWVFWVGSIMS